MRTCMSAATGRASWPCWSASSLRPGFYLLDEPEAALSFTSTLSLIARLRAGAGRVRRS